MPEEDRKIIYGLNDVPPWKDLLLLSLQQMMLLFTAATLPAMLVREVGGSLEEAGYMVALTMIAAGVGSVIQASRTRWMGSGYLCPNVCGPSYLAVSMQAAWSGGFPLMRGMIIFAGLVEMGLAGIISRLRFLFPPIVTGLTVTMVGISIIPVSVTSFIGTRFAGDYFCWQDACVGAVALAVMVGTNIWGKGSVKMYCLLLGVGSGWLLALWLQPDAFDNLERIIHAPWIDFPVHGLNQLKLGFSFRMLVPFFIIAVCGSLKSFGNLIAAQKISRPELKELDMKPIGKGLVADGFTTAMAGAMGGMAVDTSSSNVGLAAATGGRQPLDRHLRGRHLRAAGLHPQALPGHRPGSRPGGRRLDDLRRLLHDLHRPAGDALPEVRPAQDLCRGDLPHPRTGDGDGSRGLRADAPPPADLLRRTPLLDHHPGDRPLPGLPPG